MSFFDKIKKGWKAFSNKDPTDEYDKYVDSGPVSYIRPDRSTFNYFNEKTLVSVVINRMAVDAANIKSSLIKQDKDEQYVSTVDSEFNYILGVEANIDQSGFDFMKNYVSAILNEGVAVAFPTVTSDNPYSGRPFKVLEMRVGRVVQWSPRRIRIRAYDDLTGTEKEIVMPKRLCAIVENPFYNIMNEQSSTMQRLNKKIAMLDNVDEQISSGRLDIIIQLPYSINSDIKRAQAEARKRDIEMQLVGSRYGIAYTDGAEKITQLNRPAENTLQQQIEYLTKQLLSQLGITQTILDGTADENTLNNYYKRTISPILNAIKYEFNRKFLTKTAITQGQTFKFAFNQLNYIPISQLGATADAFMRNRIMTSNEVRSLIGYKPSSQPEANKLENPNMPAQEPPMQPEDAPVKISPEEKNALLNTVREQLGLPVKNQNENEGENDE